MSSDQSHKRANGGPILDGPTLVFHNDLFLCHAPGRRPRGAAKVPPRIDWENVAESMYRTAIEERRVTADRAAFARVGRRRGSGRA